ncbi:MAG: anti-sigma-factor antagonist protein [uncultured bacterium]|nr:MAG: anti-sigma-factor antagonist protein [uncultured bacterium]
MTTSKGTKKKVEKVQDSLNGQHPERVIASGDKLTIETIADFARQIQEGLSEADTVVIDFAKNVEVDITALQIFCSACLTATAMKKNFVHRGTLPQSLLDLAATAGSERKEHCKNNNMSCFRKFGGME